jgi:NAD(P)-dependent dehydrogenase (short-subunit alcohol dehydrogenase family)
MKDFRDRVAAITGAASGIGRSLSLELARRGAHLALSDVDEAGLAETGLRAKRVGVEVTTARVDVADRAAVEAWADLVVADHGRVNLIANNAGVAVGATVEGTSYEDLEWLMGINFWGVVHGTKAFLPHLRAAGEGHVVNISSIFGLMGIPSQSAYNAAKFAVRGFTEALRQEMALAGHPVKVTAVHPGGIKTAIARNMTAAEGIDIKDLADTFDKKLAGTSPEKAATIILDAVRKNKARVLVGPDAKALDLIVRLTGSGYQRLFSSVIAKALPSVH